MNVTKHSVLSFLVGFLFLTTSSGVLFAKDIRMFVRHNVADYAKWKKGYDAFGSSQKKMGVYFQSVYQSADNPNDVTVVHDFHSLLKAKEFAASSELKTSMLKLGVKGTPEIWFVNKGTIN